MSPVLNPMMNHTCKELATLEREWNFNGKFVVVHGERKSHNLGPARHLRLDRSHVVRLARVISVPPHRDRLLTRLYKVPKSTGFGDIEDKGREWILDGRAPARIHGHLYIFTIEYILNKFLSNCRLEYVNHHKNHLLCILLSLCEPWEARPECFQKCRWIHGIRVPFEKQLLDDPLVFTCDLTGCALEVRLKKVF